MDQLCLLEVFCLHTGLPLMVLGKYNMQGGSIHTVLQKQDSSRAVAMPPEKQHLVSFLPVPKSVKILVMKLSIHFLVSLFSTIDLLQQHNPLANE